MAVGPTNAEKKTQAITEAKEAIVVAENGTEEEKKAAQEKLKLALALPDK